MRRRWAERAAVAAAAAAAAAAVGAYHLLTSARSLYKSSNQLFRLLHHCIDHVNSIKPQVKANKREHGLSPLSTAVRVPPTSYTTSAQTSRACGRCGGGARG
jgi:hypothetical protein